MVNFHALGGLRAAPREVLLIAGSRPEAARLAPVAAAMAEQGRVDAVVVAGGSDPMRTHETFHSLGAPPGVTLLLGGVPDSPVHVAATLAVRLDELMAERSPAAVLVAGGGLAPLVAAQVAFFRKVPVVHLFTGTDVDDLLCPFPEEGNRRVISQLASLFLHTQGRGMLCDVAGPNSITVGDTLAAVVPADPRLADLVYRARADATQVALLDASTPVLVSVAAQLLTRFPELELVISDLPALGAAPDPTAEWLHGHPRVQRIHRPRVVDLVGIAAVAAFAATEHPERHRDVLAHGVPALLIDAPGSPADALDPNRIAGVPADQESLLRAMSGLLARAAHRPLAPAGPAAARRVEHAVAWMLGLERDPAPSTDPATAV
jgi:UDP-N-acetylglucosamine 2-epimerase (non-hydrolysing)